MLMDGYSVYYLIGLFHLINKTHQQFVNLAFGKSATISTRYNANYFAPGNVVDGKNSTYPLDCTLSASGQKEAWLQVDLGEKKNIASISFIHGGLGWNARPISRQDSGIYADSDGTGPVYIDDGRKTLCLEKFNTPNVKVICLIWGLLPGGNYKGIQTSEDIWDKNIKCLGDEVSINQCSQKSTSCDWGSVATVSCEKGSTLAGFSVYVSDTQNWTSGSICYQHDIQEIPSNNINIDCVTSGRYVTIYNSRNRTSYTSVSNDAYINICEIDVQGCETGYYGENCTRCPENCLNNSCHFQIGHCFDCEDGYTGKMCESECAIGLYGQRCSLTCGDCRDEAACNNVNGSCPDECSAGRRGDKCDLVCAETYHGPSCNLSCSAYCNDTSCDPVTGFCDACIEERSGNFCENVIDVNNFAADSFMNINGSLIAVFVLSVILILTMISISLYCIKKNCRSVKCNSTESEYQNTVVTDENNEYNQLHLKKESDSVENNTTHYMDISTIDVVSNTEYINLSFK